MSTGTLESPGMETVFDAAAHHISVRSLYKLFGQEEATVAHWIRRRRLELFRAVYGLPPAQYRDHHG